MYSPAGVYPQAMAAPYTIGESGRLLGFSVRLARWNTSR
ncbi:hypothetical protein VINI7043_07055 [Vibrio nigripulchritudo ATCC 27043]|nr:hypothetical protein VINI7043_07055 [Vibrio nigripulchritudo ATCC 27043]